MALLAKALTDAPDLVEPVDVSALPGEAERPSERSSVTKRRSRQTSVIRRPGSLLPKLAALNENSNSLAVLNEGDELDSTAEPHSAVGRVRGMFHGRNLVPAAAVTAVRFGRRAKSGPVREEVGTTAV